MLNATGQKVGKVSLTVFGGAVPEMAPSDIPEGASPWNQDVDFLPGSVFSRGGRANVYTFANLFFEDLTGFAQSIPGAFAPNEASWGAPTNATLNIPGTYAAVTLNAPLGGAAGSTFDNAAIGQGTSLTASVTGTPGRAGEVALLILAGGVNIATQAAPTPGSWSFLDNPNSGARSSMYSSFLASAAAISPSQALTGTADTWIEALLFFGSSSQSPLVNVQQQTFTSGAWGPGNINTTFSSPTTAGNGILVVVDNVLNNGAWAPTVTRAGATFTVLVNVQNGGGGAGLAVLWAPNVTPGNPTMTFNINNGGGSGTVRAYEIAGVGSLSATPSTSQLLSASNFNFNIPATDSIVGLQVEVFGNQTTSTPDAVINANLLLPNGSKSPISFSGQLPSTDGETIIGTASALWSTSLTAAILNSPAFGVQVYASALNLTTFSVYAIKVKAYVSPSPPQNFNWLKSYERTASVSQFTLALDAGGTLWQEDVINAPNLLSAIYTGINAGSFAKSVTFEDVEYIAFSDLLNGTDMPRQWNGSKLDRISQIGPAAPPSFSTTSTGSSIQSITQNAPIVLNVSPHDWLVVSAGPGAIGSFGTPATPGNVMSVFVIANVIEPAYFKVGTNIQISGFPTINGNVVNNDPTGVTNPAYYTITSVQGPAAGFQAYTWITFQVPFTTFYAHPTFPGCNIQATTATMTTAAQVPYLEVGNQFTLTGVIPSGWNNTFTVLQTPNAAVLAVTQTQLQGQVATYTYNLVSGAVPTVGQFINVTGTLNGNGIFNIQNAVIVSVSQNTFSVNIIAPNITAAAESNCFASIYGTQFVFDPAGVVTNPIIGNAGATGSIATSGIVGIGTRQGVCIFVTENGALTQPSPYAQFNVAGTASAIVVTNIPTGPPDVVARIIAFTGAGGANFFWIPAPVTVTSFGQQVTYAATIINDNTTTQATFSFPDQVLVDATAIDIQGNNLFAQFELGSCRGFLSYADRLIAWGVQNKILNLLNISFDGGIGIQNLQQLSTQPQVPNYPLGWTVDPVNGGGGSVLVSPLFGNSYYVKNATGVSQALYGMLTQPAYVNQLGTPIVNAATTYSCRVTARCPSGVQTGNLVIDFFSPVLNQIFGSQTIPLSSLTSNFQIITGTMLTSAFAKVPKDLLIRIYGTNIPNNGDFEIDRIEPFPTLQPNFSTSFVASYANNQEAFDQITGIFGPAQNQQRCNGGMVLFDTLYMLKESSWFSTSDNNLTEPNQWNWRTVSDKVGTIGIHSYDYGEAWAITACRAGLYFFEGGEPIKISQEIQPVWDLINWKFGHTIWVRNDEATKTIKIGVPIATPNVFMPEMPANANPTSPNVVLSMSYRELNTGGALAITSPIRTSYTGRLLSPEPARKWSFWNIICPYADNIDRGNNSKTLFYGSGYHDSKVFQLLATQLSDDGAAINSYYITHGMPKPEIAEARGIDVLRSQFDLLELNVSGFGNLYVWVYPEDPRNQLPYVLDTIPLDAVTQGNNEVAVNAKATRYFIRIGTNTVGSAFACSTMIGIFSPDPWAPVRGTARGAV